jgi:hypothetical protein
MFTNQEKRKALAFSIIGGLFLLAGVGAWLRTW